MTFRIPERARATAIGAAMTAAGAAPASAARAVFVAHDAWRARANPTVLIVDDNAGDAILIELALSEVGLDGVVVRVDNALRAYAFLLGTAPFDQATLPDLILLDLGLPIITGIEFLRKLRATPAWRDLAVLVFSAASEAADGAEALRLGALLCQPKPPVWSQYVHAAGAIHDAWRRHRDRPLAASGPG